MTIEFSSTSTQTRLKQKPVLWLVRLIWLAAILFEIGIYVLAFNSYTRLRDFGTLTREVTVEKQDGRFMIAPKPNTAAEKLLQGGETLLSVDGTVLTPETSLNDVILLFRGQAGTQATLEVVDASGAQRQITLQHGLLSNVMMAQSVGLNIDSAIVFYSIFEVLRWLLVIVPVALVIWRRSDDWQALLAVLSATSVAIVFSPFHEAFVIFYSETALWSIHYFLSFSGAITMLVFPDGSLRTPQTRLFFIVSLGAIAVYFFLNPLLSVTAAFVLYLFILSSILVGMVYRYRHILNPAQRQQAKWVVFGVAVCMVVVIFVNVVGMFILQNGELNNTVPALRLQFFLWLGVYISVLFIPLGISIAILRYRLWDIDLVINRSLVVAGMSVALGAVFLVLLAVLQNVLQGVLGSEQTGLAATIATAVVIALYNPVHKRVRQFVDERIYKFRFDLIELKKAQAAQPKIDTQPGVLTGKTLGRYRLLDVIGRGGMSEIYQANVIGGSGQAAVKVLPADPLRTEDLRVRLEREAQTLARLSHPHIVKLYDVGETDGVFYVALDHIEGQDLKTLLEAHHKFAWSEVKDWVQQIGSALHYLHECGFVHRDLKPANIMIRNNEEAVLMDFGIAKTLDSQTNITKTDVVIGTISYMAPEQIENSKAIDHRADIYALGIVLYELLTGQCPFTGAVGQILFAHLQQPPPNPQTLDPAIPDHVAHAILRALAKKADDRPASVQEWMQMMVA